jgi:hypothetical protein
MKAKGMLLENDQRKRRNAVIGKGLNHREK